MPINFGHLESTKIQIHETQKELSSGGGEWIESTSPQTLGREYSSSFCCVSMMHSLDMAANGCSTPILIFHKRRSTNI